MQTVGITGYAQREVAVNTARDLCRFLRGRGVTTRVHPELARLLGIPECAVDETELGRVDMLVALGGDGTVIAANRLAAPHGTPILGVHAGGSGSFGFLTETVPPNAVPAVQAWLDGHFQVEERLMVAGEVLRHGELVTRLSGLNEIVVRAQSRMLRMGVSVNGHFIATYAADGIIVATPTGSTAYNLAASGPLVDPSVNAILLTPICPHTLTVRSLLVGVEGSIHVELLTGDRDVTLLTVDGQISFQLERGDEVTFRKSELSGRFILLDSANFYKKVQSRLRLGERFGENEATGP